MNKKRSGFESVNLYFQDESRFGLFTKNGKALTLKGVKPICPFHQVFKSTYLFGAFSPINGEQFLLELPFCNADNFQIYLDEFSKFKPTELKLITLDNGAFHKAKKLKIPPNIALIFQPPYSPEVNPAEQIWAWYKRPFTNQVFKTLDQISTFIQKQTELLNNDVVTSIARYKYIFYDYWTI